MRLKKNSLFTHLLIILLSIIFTIELSGQIWKVLSQVKNDLNLSETNNDQPLKTRFKLHPYFGYSVTPGTLVEQHIRQKMIDNLSLPEQRAWIKKSANNLGFFASVDYPYFAKEDEFLVAVLGGSVSTYFTLLSEETFTRELEKYLPAGKKAKILSLSLGAYKNPQEIFVLAYLIYLGQKFDLIVSIDGFNEVGSVSKNPEYGLDPSMPHAPIISSLNQIISGKSLRRTSLNKIGLISLTQQSLDFLSHLAATTIFGTVFSFSKISANISERFLEKLEQSLAQESSGENNKSLLLFSKPVLRRDLDKLENAALSWQRAIQMINSIAKNAGSSYLAVLQPNQYYSKKLMSQAEKEIAIDENLRPEIFSGYEKFIRAENSLKEQGLAFYDATSIFDSYDEKIFADSCCHFNQLGNDILAREIARVAQERKLLN